MKKNYGVYAWKSILLIAILVILNGAVMAQVPSDTTKVKMPADTAKPAQATTSPASEKKAKPKQFNFYVGLNSNTMSGSTASYNANSALGYQIGIAFKKGGFTYWQVGLMYNYSAYGFNSTATHIDSGKFNIQALDIPVTLGINFLSFAKIVSLRAYVSAMPAFTLGVGNNDFGITKDDVNSFVFYVQGGIGVDILFLMVDIGYNYGTQSLMKNSVSSTNPGQVYVNLGFRF
jgi:FlaG/FlaF family flagellin (archaellin)